MLLKSNEPFWLVKNGTLHSYPSLHHHIKTDVVIAGAGITGALIAHQCMEDGFDCVLIDKREVANGSTSATTSMLQYEVDIPLYQLIDKIGAGGAAASYWACYDSIDTIQKVCRQIKSGCGYKKKDSLYFAAAKKDQASLCKEFETRAAYGFPVSWLSSDTIHSGYGIPDTFGGILSTQGASVDAFRLTHDLIHFNYARGLRVYDKTELVQTQYKRNSVTITTEHGSTILAKKIIYCTGFESALQIPEKFVNLISTYAIVSEQFNELPKALNETLFWNTAVPYLYFRTTRDNRILIGGEDENFRNPQKRDSLLNAKSKKLEKKIRALLPDFAYHTDFTWTGTFGETKDGLPYIGTHPKFPQSYFVLGFGGNGITFSAIGMQMTSAFLHRKKHALDEFFKFGR